MENSLPFLKKLVLSDEELKKEQDKAIAALKEEDRELYGQVLSFTKDEKAIRNSLSKILEVKENRKECLSCPGYAFCPREQMRGYQESLIYHGQNGGFDISLVPCKYKEEIERIYASLVYSDFPLGTTYTTSDRIISYFQRKPKTGVTDSFAYVGKIAFKKMALYKGNGLNKGLFVKSLNDNAQNLGLGLAFNFARKKVDTALLDAGHLLKEVQSRDEEVKKKALSQLDELQEVKAVFVLNLGQEYPSSSFRDDVLVPFFSSRLGQGKFTYLSSVYSLDDYVTRYSVHDEVAGKTLKELILSFADPYLISDLPW